MQEKIYLGIERERRREKGKLSISCGRDIYGGEGFIIVKLVYYNSFK